MCKRREELKNVTLDADGRLFVDGAEVATPLPQEEDIEFLDAWEKSEERYEDQNRLRDALTIHAWLETQSFGKSIIGEPMPVGTCPECGGDLVSNLYCAPGGKDFTARWECVNSFGEGATCDYSQDPNI
jgi:hypothetical protein